MKKVIALTLTLILCLSLAACGREVSGMGEHETVPTKPTDHIKEPENELVGSWIGIFDVDYDFPTIVFYPDYTYEVYDYEFGEQEYELAYTNKYALEGNELVMWYDNGEVSRSSYSLNGTILTITDVETLWFAKSSPESSLTDGWWYPLDATWIDECSWFNVGGCGYSISAMIFYSDETLEFICDGYSQHGTYSIIHDGSAIYIEMNNYDDVFYIERDEFGLLTLTSADGDTYVFFLVP